MTTANSQKSSTRAGKTHSEQDIKSPEKLTHTIGSANPKVVNPSRTAPNPAKNKPNKQLGLFDE